MSCIKFVHNLNFLFIIILILIKFIILIFFFFTSVIDFEHSGVICLSPDAAALKRKKNS